MRHGRQRPAAFAGPVEIDQEIDFERVMARMNEIRHGSRDGLRDWLESEEAVTFFHDWGCFVGKKEIAVDGTVITGDTIFINVGARARVPDILGLDAVNWLDNRRILELSDVPDHLVIIGGSYLRRWDSASSGPSPPRRR